VRSLALLLALASASSAETLRFATIAPEGTAWAREAHAFAREVETLTGGALRVKWYMGAIAGDELQVLERIRRGQLDGMAAAHGCDRIAPSLRVMNVVGLFRSHEEILFVLGKLQPLFEREFHQHGFVDLGMGGGFGQTIFLGRQPARTLADLKHVKLWIWDLDEVPRVQLAAMGLPLVPLPVENAAHAYDDKQVDGFVALPQAALAYQWSAQARYFTPLLGGFLPACLAVSTAAWDALPVEQQQALRHASATTVARFEEVGRTQDQQLLEGLFEKQGLKRVPVTPALAREFDQAAIAAREQLGASLVSADIMRQVAALLDEYRKKP
jgi:TRAP-type C4-dicarboxylate transport system substrate-binding protein